MNPESANPLLRATGTATGSFNLRKFNESGYVAAERALARVIGRDVSEDAIIAAGKDPLKARQIQLVINNFYEGKYNGKLNRQSLRESQAYARQRAKGTGKYGTYPTRATGMSYRPSIGRKDEVEHHGETFSDYNQPKRTPSHPTKSHAVLAKEGETVKLIRFGQQGVKGSPAKEGESESYRNRRRSFQARHAKNIAKGKMSAAYWANREKW